MNNNECRYCGEYDNGHNSCSRSEDKRHDFSPTTETDETMASILSWERTEMREVEYLEVSAARDRATGK